MIDGYNAIQSEKDGSLTPFHVNVSQSPEFCSTLLEVVNLTDGSVNIIAMVAAPDSSYYYLTLRLLFHNLKNRMGCNTCERDNFQKTSTG
jgi:hypothetical protein